MDDAEVEINDVLGEGDNITFIVRIYALVTGNPHPHPGETWGIRGDLQVLR